MAVITGKLREAGKVPANTEVVFKSLDNEVIVDQVGIVPGEVRTRTNASGYFTSVLDFGRYSMSYGKANHTIVVPNDDNTYDWTELLSSEAIQPEGAGSTSPQASPTVYGLVKTNRSGAPIVPTVDWYWFSDERLIEMVLNGSVKTVETTADDANGILTAIVRWPNGSTGTYTRTAVDATFETWAAYEITNEDAGKVVSRGPVTRNDRGEIISEEDPTVDDI